MTVVDTHAHASPGWFEPIEVILFQMDSNKVDKLALIQMLGQPDNSYIIECAQRFPGKFSPVVVLDTNQFDATTKLEQLAKDGAEGIRLRATNRSPGDDSLAIWRKALELGLPVSCLGSPEEISSEEFEMVVQQLPGLRIVIEHMGSQGRIDAAPPYTTYRKVLELSRYPNTYIKIVSLGQLSPRSAPFDSSSPFQNIPPLIDMAIDAFGAHRCMWGSDYPPTGGREGYGNAQRYLRDHLSKRTEEEREWVFGKTALSVFKFGA